MAFIITDLVKRMESVKINVPKIAVTFSFLLSYHSTTDTGLCSVWLRGFITESDGNILSLPSHTPALCLPEGYPLTTT
jgi:hypothetical protein